MLKKKWSLIGGGLGKTKQASITEEVLKAFDGMLALDARGRLCFTTPGRRTYAPLFSRIGVHLDDIDTAEAFLDAFRRATGIKSVQEFNSLRDVLHCSASTESQKRITRRLLGLSPEAPATVVTLHDIRSRRTGAL
jgi:hypothetical protein